MKQENYPVAVYCINPKYDIDADYRLNFLKEQGVIVDSIYNGFDQKLNAVHHRLRYLFLPPTASNLIPMVEKKVRFW
jgi:hypothetical protein